MLLDSLRSSLLYNFRVVYVRLTRGGHNLVHDHLFVRVGDVSRQICHGRWVGHVSVCVLSQGLLLGVHLRGLRAHAEVALDGLDLTWDSQKGVITNLSLLWFDLLDDVLVIFER